MSVLGTLGTLVAYGAEILAIISTCKEIISETDSLLEEVDDLLETLGAESEGSYKDAVVEACNWLSDKFRSLISAVTSIFDSIKQAMDDNERADTEGAGLLKELIR